MNPRLSNDFSWEMDEFTSMVEDTMQVDSMLTYRDIYVNWINFFACYQMEQPKWKEIN